MKTPVKIEIDSPKLTPEIHKELIEVEKTLQERYLKQHETLKGKGLWNDNIVKVVFCLDLEAYVNKFNDKWSTSYFMTKEKEFTSNAINLSTIKDEIREITIAISIDVYRMGVTTMDMIFFKQVFIEKSHDYLSESLVDMKLNGITTDKAKNFDIVFEQAYSIWFSIYFTEYFTSKIFEEEREAEAHDKYMTNFKRNVRTILYEAQSDSAGENVWMFVWGKYVHLFTNLIRNLLTDKTTDSKLRLQNAKEAEICYEICEEVKRNFFNTLKNEEFNLDRIKELFIEFSELHSIHITPNKPGSPHGVHFNFKINPKELFKNEVVETLPSFVAFIDILGFSKMIESYQSDPQSTLLQKLKEAFDNAVNATKDVVDRLDGSFLEYRLFSDNFSASIPYFESKQDFLAGLNIMFLLIKNYQYQLMLHGFFVRGGFAHGDYYSDENMIFSGALVEAYYLESKEALYPRVLISEKTIEAIESYLDENEMLPENMQNSILYSPEENVYFVNPYMNLKKELDSFKELTEENIPELLPILELVINFDEEEISDKNIVEPIQKELNLQMETLIRNQNEKAYEKLKWLYDFNEWYIKQNSAKYSFYRS